MSKCETNDKNEKNDALSIFPALLNMSGDRSAVIVQQYLLVKFNPQSALNINSLIVLRWNDLQAVGLSTRLYRQTVSVGAITQSPLRLSYELIGLIASSFRGG